MQIKKKIFLLLSATILSFFLFYCYISPGEVLTVTEPLSGEQKSSNRTEKEPYLIEDNWQRRTTLAGKVIKEHNEEKKKENLPLQVSLGEEGKPLWDENIIAKLLFLQSPLPEARVSSKDSHLPGAPRPYRNGIHQGLDYYGGYCGIDVVFGDPVYAAGPGTIYRIDHFYEEPAVDEREDILKKDREMGDNDKEILDMLRGRQVWILHNNGIITRYAHLDQVAENLQVGSKVKAGDYIGTVGNSGTSDGARGNTSNPHLHFEIWVGYHYLGEGLPPGEVRKLWQRVLDNHDHPGEEIKDR